MALPQDLSRVMQSAWRAMWMPSVFLVSATATVLGDVASQALGADRGFWNLPTTTMLWLSAVAAVQFWISLGVMITALDHMRHEYLPGPPRIVSPSRALEAGVVSVALVLPILGGLLLLVVPGVLLALRWSQTTLLIAEGEDTWRTATHGSDTLTMGKKTFILMVWLASGAVVVGTGWLASTIGAMLLSLDLTAAPRVCDLAGRALSDTFSLSIVAALYHDLRTHA